MLLTKDKIIAELEAEQANNNHILYETADCVFHAAKLISIEPYFVETKETNDVGFTKTSMKGFFRLKFQEGEEVKTYEADANPESVNKVYYYVTKDGSITNMFPDKEDIIAYATQEFNRTNKSNEDDSSNRPTLWFMMAPLMVLPLSVMLEAYQIPLFFKLGLSLLWILAFIGFLFSPSPEKDESQPCESQKIKLQSFIKHVKNFEE